jgi:hypothetical protein
VLIRSRFMVLCSPREQIETELENDKNLDDI